MLNFRAHRAGRGRYVTRGVVDPRPLPPFGINPAVHVDMHRGAVREVAHHICWEPVDKGSGPTLQPDMMILHDAGHTARRRWDRKIGQSGVWH